LCENIFQAFFKNLFFLILKERGYFSFLMQKVLLKKVPTLSRRILPAKV
jgi:hypothetical protein